MANSLIKRPNKEKNFELESKRQISSFPEFIYRIMPLGLILFGFVTTFVIFYNFNFSKHISGGTFEYTSDLVKLTSYYAQLIMGMFAGLSFIYTWSNLVNASRINTNDKGMAILDPYEDQGLIYLSLSMLCWVLSAFLNIYYLTYLNLEYKEVNIVFFVILSTLNSSFFLVTASYFKYGSSMPIWLRKMLEDPKKFRLRIAIVTVGLVISQLIIDRVEGQGVWVDVPDLLYSFFTVLILMLSISSLFKDRGLSSGFIFLVYATLIITFLAQILRFLEIFDLVSSKDDFTLLFLQESINILYQFFLIAIFLMLAFSWALLASRDSSKARLEEVENLKRDAQHRHKNILLYIGEAVESHKKVLLQGDTPEVYSQAVEPILNDIRFVIEAFLSIAASERQDSASFNKTITNIKDKLNEIFNLYEFEMFVNIDKEIFVNVNRLDQIVGMIMELSLNSVEHNDSLVKEIKVEVENVLDTAIRIVVEDNGKGYNETEIRPGAFGLKNIRETIKKWEGSFEVFSKNPGTRINIMIPINQLK